MLISIFNDLIVLLSRGSLTLGHTRKLIPPPWYKEGGAWGLLQPLSWVFMVLQYLGNILPLMDSLSCDLHDKVNIIGYGAARVRCLIQNGRQDGRHLEICYKIKFIRKLGNCKKYYARVENIIPLNILLLLVAFFTFYAEKR